MASLLRRIRKALFVLNTKTVAAVSGTNVKVSRSEAVIWLTRALPGRRRIPIRGS